MGLHTSRHTRKNSSFSTQDKHMVLLGLEALPSASHLHYATCSKYKDRHVLIKGDRVVADFESRGDALREGYKRFGHEAFLVKKVEEVEEVNFLRRALVD
jgi:hypothetical protein